MQRHYKHRSFRHNLSVHQGIMITLLVFLLLLAGCNATGKAYQQTTTGEGQQDCNQGGCTTQSLEAEQARIGTLEVTTDFSVQGQKCGAGETLIKGNAGQWECVAFFAANVSPLRECNFFALEAGDGQQTCLHQGYSLCMAEQYATITRYYDSVGTQCQGLVQIEMTDTQQGPCPTSSTQATGCYVNQEGTEPFSGDVSIVTARGSNSSQVLCCR